MARRLALIAGAGQMVPLLVAAFEARGETLRIIDIVGRTDLDGPDIERISLGDAPRLLAALRSYRPTHLTLAGGVSISDAERQGLADAFGFAGKLAQSLGDLGLAGLVWLEARRLRARLVGAHEVLPELLAPAGRIAGPVVSAEWESMARHALTLARRIGATDLGQAVVTAGRRPVAAEDAGGTDALIARAGALRAAGKAGSASAPLILAKALKPRQPKFADLPAIGPDTVRRAAEAGIAVIAVEAGQSLVIDRAGLTESADALGISVVGLNA